MEKEDILMPADVALASPRKTKKNLTLTEPLLSFLRKQKHQTVLLARQARLRLGSRLGARGLDRSVRSEVREGARRRERAGSRGVVVVAPSAARRRRRVFRPPRRRRRRRSSGRRLLPPSSSRRFFGFFFFFF